MNFHERHEKQVIYAQIICFLLASIFGFTADVFNDATRQIIYKFVDSLFITGTLLVAMKLAREGWDMPAAGYTLVSIAWGSLFLAKDFQQLSVGQDISASSFLDTSGETLAKHGNRKLPGKAPMLEALAAA